MYLSFLVFLSQRNEYRSRMPLALRFVVSCPLGPPSPTLSSEMLIHDLLARPYEMGIDPPLPSGLSFVTLGLAGLECQDEAGVRHPRGVLSG